VTWELIQAGVALPQANVHGILSVAARRMRNPRLMNKRPDCVAT